MAPECVCVCENVQKQKRNQFYRSLIAINLMT